MRKFELVIFDLDGTLIDNRVAIRDNFNHALSLFGYSPLPNSQIDFMIGTPLLEMFVMILKEADKQLASKLVDEYQKRYQDTGHEGVVILDSVIQTLEYLKDSGLKLAIATQKADEYAKLVLGRIGLSGYFDLIVGFREGISAKPHPDMLQHIITELNVSRNKTAFVGDTPTDVVTAKNAGVYSVAVTSGVSLGMTTLEKIQETMPDMIINSLAELKNILVK